MVVSEFVLLIARVGVLALMFLLLLVLILAIRADAPASITPSRPQPKPLPDRKPPPPPPAATPPRALAVTGGSMPTSGQEYQLFGPLQVGRSPSNNISLPNNFVSSHHARFFSQDGLWFIEDLGSTNGTLVNNIPVTSPRMIVPGDKILIGDTEFTVQ